MRPFWQDLPLPVSLESRNTSRHTLDNVVRHELGPGRRQSNLDPADTGGPLYMSNRHHF